MPLALKILMAAIFVVMMASVSMSVRWLDAGYGPVATFGLGFALVGVGFLIDWLGRKNRRS